jgi:hypothetical protein
MHSFLFAVFLAASVLTVPTCWAGRKIVVLYPFSSKSHLMSVMPIVEELAHRGHNITIVTCVKIPMLESIREIYLPGLAERFEALTPNMFQMSKEGQLIKKPLNT